MSERSMVALDARLSRESAKATLLGVRPRPVRLGAFDLIRRVAEGGCGVVYEAVETGTLDPVALKRLRSSRASDLSALKREFRALGSVRHQNVARFHDLRSCEGVWFITMEFVDGVHLDRVLTRRVCRRRWLHLLLQLCDGLAALHGAGICHGDLKPSNVLVEDRTGRVVLVDFGLTLRGEMIARGGTRGYQSAERQADGHVSAQDDCYALGKILSRLLADLTGDTSADVAWVRRELSPLAAALQRPLLERATLAEVRTLLLRLADNEGVRVTEFSALPDGHARGASFVGRKALIAQLSTALRDDPCAVLVDGASGVGKSALVERALERLPERTVRLRGRCHPREKRRLRVVAEILDGLSEHLGSRYRAAEAVLTAEARTLLGPGAASEQPSPGAKRQLTRFLVETLSECLREGPLVLFIDDLTWADRESAVVLADALEVLLERGLRFVGCLRRDLRDGGFGEQLEAALVSHGRSLRRFEVGALTPSEVRRLAALTCPELDSDARRAVARMAWGLPILTRSLSQVARVSSAGDLLSALLDTLPSSARRTLAALALTQRPTSEGVLARACHAGRLTEAVDKCQQLASTGLVHHDSDGSAQLACPGLTSDALRGLSVAALRDLHLRLAAAYREEPAVGVAHLARHLDAADALDALCAHAIEAARLSRRIRRFDDEVEWLLLALEHAGRRPCRTYLHGRVARALSDACHPVDATGHYRQARELATRAGFPLLAERYGRMEVRLRLRTEPTGAALLAARAMLESHGVRMPTGLANAILSTVRECALAWFQRLDPLARPDRSGERPGLLDALAVGAFEMSAISPVISLGLHARYRLEARRMGARHRELQALAAEAYVIAQAGPLFYPRRRRLLSKCHALARTLNTDYARGLAALAEASCALWSEGSLPERMACAEDAVAYLTRSREATLERDTARLVHLYCAERIGVVDECVAACRTSLLALERDPSAFSICVNAPSACYGLQLKGDATRLRAILDHIDSHSPPNIMRRPLHFRRAFLALMEGDEVRGLAAFERDLWMPNRLAPMSLVATRHPRSMTGASLSLAAFFRTRDPRYLSRLQAHLRGFDRLGCHLPASRRAYSGLVLAVRGAVDLARHELSGAADAYRACGYALLATVADYRRAQIEGDSAAVEAIECDLRNAGASRPEQLMWTYLPFDPACLRDRVR